MRTPTSKLKHLMDTLEVQDHILIGCCVCSGCSGYFNRGGAISGYQWDMPKQTDTLGVKGYTKIGMTRGPE